MKTIFFVQHGLAHNKDVSVDRNLSDLGRKQTSKVATYLQNNNIVINKICHSGKLRAEQTAQIFSQVLAVNNICGLSYLSPKGDPDQLISQINEDAVMYIGHLPNLQKVLSKLLCNDQDNKVVSLQNSAVACIEIEAEQASLKWFITADMC